MSKPSVRLFVLGMGILPLAFAPSGNCAEPQVDTRTIRPLVSFVGSDTRIAENRVQRITNQQEWTLHWLQHTGQAGRPEDFDQYRRTGAPAIDFGLCMVIAITESPGSQNAGITASAISETPDQIVFDYDGLYYQSRDGTSAPGNAFGYFVVPRSPKPVIVRKNAQTGHSRYTDGEPIWKEVATFDALEETISPLGHHEPAAINIVFAHDPGIGRYDGIVGRPTDTWNFVRVGTRKIAALKSSRGLKTGVEFELSDNDGSWGIPDQSGIFHGYIYHNCQCVDLTATLHNVPMGIYRLYVFAHGDAPNQNADIALRVGDEQLGRKPTLNDGSWDFQSLEYEEGVQFVSFEFVTDGRQPVQITSHRSGSSYSMLNAIQLVPVVE